MIKLPTPILALALSTVMVGSAFAHTCPEFTDLSNAEIYGAPFAAETPTSKWVYQEFQHNGEPSRDSVSGWRVRFSERGEDHSKWTLAIDEAWFTTSEGREIKVLGGLWPAQIWVPYEQEDVVLFDLRHGAKLTPMLLDHATWECSQLGPDFASPHSDDNGIDRPIFMTELHDYGVSEMRLHPETDDIWRRGTELVVWANSDAGNYDNYIKYHFRDDGQILAFVGTSGWNTSALMGETTSRSGWNPHLHSALWRIQPKIGDWRLNDKVYKVSYNQNLAANGGKEKLHINQFTQEIDFNDEPDEYLSVLFEDEKTINGKNMGYAVSRISPGSPRHRVLINNNSVATPNDYFLRRYHQDELDLQFVETGPSGDRISLLNIEDEHPREWIDNGGAVLFATTSVKHIPRNEDFVITPRDEYPTSADGTDFVTDSVHYNSVYSPLAYQNRNKISWHGVELSPRNIHRNTPFSTDQDGGPCCTPIPAQTGTDQFAWTAWLNRDGPGGSGDWETLNDFPPAQVCPNPVEIQCQTVTSKELSIDTGEVYQCALPGGGVCKNSDQGDGSCENYEVRFLCPM